MLSHFDSIQERDREMVESSSAPVLYRTNPDIKVMHYLSLNVSETAKDTAIVAIEGE